MGGTFALMFGIWGLFLAFASNEADKAPLKGLQEMERADELEHYYNKELQWDIKFLDNNVIEMFSGLNQEEILEELRQKYGECCQIYCAAKLKMVKKVMQNFGYDYQNEYDIQLDKYSIKV